MKQEHVPTMTFKGFDFWLKKSVDWWFHLTSRKAADESASLKDHELAIRSRIASIVILVAFLLAAIALPGAFSYPNKWLPVILVAVLFLQVTGFVVNRRGHTILAGIFVVCSSEIGLATTIVTQPLSTNVVPIFDLLVQPLAFAVSLLPAFYVFAVAGVNVLFILGAYFLLPHTRDFDQLVLPQYYIVLLRPIILQVCVAIVTFTWVTLSNRAISRANRLIQESNVKQRWLDAEHAHLQRMALTLTLIESICNEEALPDQASFDMLDDRSRAIVYNVWALSQRTRHDEEKAQHVMNALQLYHPEFFSDDNRVDEAALIKALRNLPS